MDNTRFYTDVSFRSNKIYHRFVENGIHYEEVVDAVPELFIRSNTPNSQFKSMHNEPLDRIEFEDSNAMRKFFADYKDVSGFAVYGSENHVNQFVTKNYPINMVFDTKYIKYGKLDIETFSGRIENGEFIDGPFPDPETAEHPVVLITLYINETDTYYVWGLEYMNGYHLGTYVPRAGSRVEGLKVVYQGFRDEYAMLMSFLNFWHDAKLNAWSGWNIEGFDNPYLTNRVENVCGKTAKHKLSPWNIVIRNTRKNDWGEESTVYDFMGCAMLDYMALFKKHAFMNPDDYKLNTVAEMVLGEGKVEYHENNPNELYAKNYQMAVEYNIVDVKVLVDIDRKMQLIDLTFTLAYMTTSNYQDTLGTVKPWSALAYSMLYARKTLPMIKSLYQGNTRFAGGFVREVTNPGKFRWIVSCDLNSLYPHIMQMYNLGAETIVEPEDLPPEIRNLPMFTLDDLVNKRVDLSVLKKYDLTMTANRQFFRRATMSIWNSKTREIYDTRKKVKKEMLALKQQKVDLKAIMEKNGATREQEVRYEELERQIKAKDNFQHSCKILMNSLFGALGNKYFREYFDIRVAEGITMSGQMAILWITRKLDEYFNKALGLGEVLHEVYNTKYPDPETILHVRKGKNFAIYQDTDSCYIDVSMLVDKLFTKEQQEENPERVINFIDKLFAEKIEPFIDESYKEMADYLNAYEHRMFMKREVIAPVAIWTQKKRYTMLVADSEGVRYWPSMDHKIMGLDAKKAQFSKKCREWLEESYMIALTGEESELHEFVKQKKVEFFSLEVEAISIPKGVNGIETYYDPQTIYKKGSPKHVKAALWHNKLVQEKGLKIAPIKSGDKIKYVELKRNPRGIECIAFQGKLPVEFDLHKYVDFENNFNKNFIDPLHNLIDSINWDHEKKQSLMDWF